MKKLFALSALALAAIALVACGSSSSDNSSTTKTPGGTAKGGTGKGSAASGGGATVKVAADPTGQLKFDTTKLTAKAGSNTFDFTNDAPVSHNFTIEDSSGKTVAASPTFAGGSKTVTANLKPGTYTYVCTVPGHEAAGMKGTLTVK
jgi:plastocyanin